MGFGRKLSLLQKQWGMAQGAGRRAAPWVGDGQPPETVRGVTHLVNVPAYLPRRNQ